MSKLCEEIAVNASTDEAERGILHYLDAHRQGGTIVIPLKIDLRDFGLPQGPSVQREVRVHAERRRDAENINDEIGIAWTPEEGGPYPSFDGRLIVWSSGAPDESFIEISGEYTPPGGLAGRLFDDAAGHLIAQRTAHEFLAALKGGILAMKENPNALNR